MLIFLTAVAVVLVVSFLCSIFESVLLSLTRPQVEVVQQTNPRAGRLLAGFKENMDVPIAAILILNTAIFTVGTRFKIVGIIITIKRSPPGFINNGNTINNIERLIVSCNGSVSSNDNPGGRSYSGIGFN